MIQKRKTFSIGFEQLENRRLLAADLGFNLPHHFPDAEILMIAEASHRMEFLMDSRGEQDCSDPNSVDQQTESIATPIESESEVVDPGVVLDLSDGTDGMFGTVDADSPTEKASFVAPDNGTANVVISSSFGDADTNIEVRDSAGELVTSSSTEGLDGFQQISFDVDAGETYAMTVSSGDQGQGNFQLTVEFEADPPIEPVDLHVDEIGPEATVLDMVEGETAIAGDLEVDGDVDVFQFQAAADGEVSLHMGEMTDGNQVMLELTVHNSEGEQLLAGATNEFVELKFDVTAGETIYVSVSAGEGQTGSYNLHLQQAIAETVAPTPEPVDLHADEIGPDATLLEPVDGYAYVRSELETGADADAFRFVAESDGQMEIQFAGISEGQESSLNVSVFDDQGVLLVEGLTNDDLSLKLDTLEGTEYQILVDSVNDLPASYQLNTVAELGEPEPPVGTGLVEAGKSELDLAIAAVDDLEMDENNDDCDTMRDLALATLDYSFYDRAIESFGSFSMNLS